MKITIEENDIEKAKRILNADDAFSLLWGIDNLLRGYVKHGTEKTREEVCDEVRDMICESGLMELWT